MTPFDRSSRVFDALAYSQYVSAGGFIRNGPRTFRRDRTERTAPGFAGKTLMRMDGEAALSPDFVNLTTGRYEICGVRGFGKLNDPL